RVAFSQAGNLKARYHMSAAAMLAGLAYGTDSAGAAHAMSQTAGGVHDAPHGALTARLLGPVMEYNHSGEPERFARMAQIRARYARRFHLARRGDGRRICSPADRRRRHSRHARARLQPRRDPDARG